MQGGVLILAGDRGHTGYPCALAQVLHEKASSSFLVPVRDALSERRPRKFGEVDFLIELQGPKTPRTIKNREGIERCRKEFG